ncbi:hypothetical protein CFOL_v3_25261 [Cephalotus follicularis]|uniref:DUF3598 domain-containing protein n=1 Tax=Cephalotus follicularis TaxID=3775 RepID=A0A1Q3CP20_CEPFO|nr:hypothetical protein CFOL_v3_25261 [Cephalotus follicularis]
MALAANCIILQNRTLNYLSLPLLKLRTTTQYSKLIIFHSSSHFRPTNQCNSQIATISCVGKTTVTDADVQVQNFNINSTTTSSWTEFVKNVSGEWDGYGADFTSEGNPIELPEFVVPEAYREWEVKVFDWQTQCPTDAQLEDLVMIYNSIKLLPTVGCEADAATRYSIDERNVGGVDNQVSAFAYQSSGCYVAIRQIEGPVTNKLLELEHCLISPKDKESRVRIIQVVNVDDAKIMLKNVKVYCEQWYGPFRNGDQLGGCALRDPPFASTAAMDASEVVGVWQGPNAVASFNSFDTNYIQELVDDSVRKSVRDESDLILLPKKLWCSLKESENGETFCEVGWLFDHGCAITSRCIFSTDARLKEICIAQETAILEGA